MVEFHDDRVPAVADRAQDVRRGKGPDNYTYDACVPTDNATRGMKMAEHRKQTINRRYFNGDCILSLWRRLGVKSFPNA